MLALYGFTGYADIPAAARVLLAVGNADIPQAGDLAADLLGGEFLIDRREAVKEELRPVVLLDRWLAERHAVYVLCFRHTLLIFDVTADAENSVCRPMYILSFTFLYFPFLYFPLLCGFSPPKLCRNTVITGFRHAITKTNHSHSTVSKSYHGLASRVSAACL